ncbi:hypothetical protein EM308_11605 [Flavobacterium gilvum]|uniref:Uncharacterized protein n=1 Tax=Flavobacterium gilvum TaxID=1492737 RepID=A0AAC9I492_9FLAO|nr:hypothetical protein EM308_11605 [Flavobacterium gilvum]
MFSGRWVPLYVAILFAEPRQTRISTTIGAKERDLAFFSSFPKEKNNRTYNFFNNFFNNFLIKLKNYAFATNCTIFFLN